VEELVDGMFDWSFFSKCNIKRTIVKEKNPDCKIKILKSLSVFIDE
jgi:hypothetical protein